MATPLASHSTLWSRTPLPPHMGPPGTPHLWLLQWLHILLCSRSTPYIGPPKAATPMAIPMASYSALWSRPTPHIGPPGGPTPIATSYSASMVPANIPTSVLPGPPLHCPGQPSLLLWLYIPLHGPGHPHPSSVLLGPLLLWLLLWRYIPLHGTGQPFTSVFPGPLLLWLLL